MSTTTKRKKKRLRNECFKLLREISLKREPICVVCGKNNATDAHHFIPRSLCQHLQLDLDNVVSVCRGCHIDIERNKNPEALDKVKAARPSGWANNLYEKRRQIQHGMWTVTYLEDKKAELLLIAP